MKTICTTGMAGKRRHRQQPAPSGRTSSACAHSGDRSERGVALVITLLMLVVITTMAVAFLLLSQRETAAVSSLHSTTDAGYANDAAQERAKAQILAPFLDSKTGSNEVMGPDFTVSLANTNWPDPLALDAGPPVIVDTNRPGFSGPLDNRFFLDLNRNDYFEETGPEVNVTDDLYATTGQKAALVGDPMWIGMRQDSKKPHGRDNYYIARYAYLIQPIGRSLDLNWIHNDAVNQQILGDIGYFRNQGIGPWELNLAGFLADLNSNVWNNVGPVSDIRYQHTTNNLNQPAGDAFKDAQWLWTNRLAGSKYNAVGIKRLFGSAGEFEFGNNGVDSFSNGPLLPWGYDTAGFTDANKFDNSPSAPGYDALKPWPGADSPRHYFTPQELFDTVKFPSPGGGQSNFRDRLRYASNKGKTEDRYTFYRMLSQLGTDSAPEKDDKIDVNYINVGGVSSSELIAWTTNGGQAFEKRFDPNFLLTNGATGPEMFMNVVLQRMFREEGYRFDPIFPDTPFAIPVYTNLPASSDGTAFFKDPFGRFLPNYSPRIHQMVQMTANILEAMSAQKSQTDNLYPYYPYVFRPKFAQRNGEIFIVKYVLADNVRFPDVQTNGNYKWYDLSRPAERSASVSDVNASFYDVPWIYGARKGIPNFNELNLQTHVLLKRYIQLERRSGAVMTNEMLVIGVTNFQFTEFLNAYSNYNNRLDYPRPLVPYVVNEMKVSLTNDSGFILTTNLTGQQLFESYPNPLIAWTNGYKINTNPLIASFPAVLISPAGTIRPATPLVFDQGSYPYANWGVTLESRYRCYLFDNNRLVDSFTSARTSIAMKLTDALMDQDLAVPDPRLKMFTSRKIGQVTEGVRNQVALNLNVEGRDTTTAGWVGYAELERLAGFSTVKAAIDRTKEWFAGTNANEVPTYILPFNPMRRLVQIGTWQANDPLVHYNLNDLYDPYNTAISNTVSTRIRTAVAPKGNPGGQNDHATLERKNVTYFQSGAGDNPYALAVRDPMIGTPDAWEFPSQSTNAVVAAKYPNVGWLGRVHRGTPWQTIYFKADDVTFSGTLNNPLTSGWRRQTGGAFMPETFPTNDWRLLDIFTASVHPNVTRGRLSINQTNPAAWSAVFSGLGVTTISDTPAGTFEPVDGVMQPVSVDAAGFNKDAAVLRLVEEINEARSQLTNSPLPAGRLVGQFTKLSDLLAVKALTTGSPYLNPPYMSPDAKANQASANFLATDADYERIPQQIAGLVKVGEPRYVVYAWGQSLKPAGNLAGLGFGIDASSKIPRNYQVTGEMATRAVVKIEYERDGSGKPNRFRPRAVIESFNILPTD